MYHNIEDGVDRIVRVESDCTPNAIMKARAQGAGLGDYRAWRCVPEEDYNRNAIGDFLRDWIRINKKARKVAN